MHRAEHDPDNRAISCIPAGPHDDEASAISDVVFILQGDTGWTIQLVGRYHDTFHHDDGAWKIHQRVAKFVQ